MSLSFYDKVEYHIIIIIMPYVHIIIITERATRGTGPSRLKILKQKKNCRTREETRFFLDMITQTIMLARKEAGCYLQLFTTLP